MEPTLTPTTQPTATPPRLTRRGIVLILVGVIVAGALLTYSGGLNQLSRIFSSKAGTEHTLTLAGVANLSGTDGAADWVVSSLPASFDNTVALPNAANVPDFMLPDATATGFVTPLSGASMIEGTITAHRYLSPAINLGEGQRQLSQIKIYAYLPASTAIDFGFRASNDLSNLTSAALQSFPEISFVPVADAANVQVATILMSQPIEQYLQLSAIFTAAGAENPPAIYGWEIQYSSETTSADTGNSGSTFTNTANNTITISYSGGPAIPTDATIKLLGSDLALNPMYGQEKLNLASGGGEYIITLPLPTGAYTIVVTSPTTKPIIAPFMLTAGQATNVAIGAFEPATGTSDAGLTGNPADLNHDGVVNVLDAQLLFEQYGK